MHKTIVHCEIYGDNPPRLADFYHKLLGWKVEKVPDPMEYWLIKTVPTDTQGRPTANGVNGGMMKRPSPEAPGWLNYVQVESVDEAVREVQKQRSSTTSRDSTIPTDDTQPWTTCRRLRMRGGGRRGSELPSRHPSTESGQLHSVS